MFYSHPMMGDGHLGKCKECTKTDVRINRLKNVEAIREYDRKRSKTAKRKAYTAEAVRRWNLENPLGYKAHCILNNAVRDGKLERQPCEICGAPETHGHHPDYSKPLEVRWLCVIHHSHLHHQKQ